MSLSFRHANWLRPQSLQAGVLVVLTPVAGIEPWGLEPRRSKLGQFLLCLPFWWSLRGFSKILARSEQWESIVCVFWERNVREPWSLVWSLVGFETEQWPQWQQTFISQTHKVRFRAALATAIIAFLIAWSQVSFWRPLCLAWAWMEGLRPSRNRRIKTGSKITALALNSWETVCKWSRWAIQSIISSN